MGVEDPIFGDLGVLSDSRLKNFKIKGKTNIKSLTFSFSSFSLFSIGLLTDKERSVDTDCTASPLSCIGKLSLDVTNKIKDYIKLTTLL